MNSQALPNSTEAEQLSKVKLGLLCFIAVSPSLGTAIAALGRLLLYVWGLGALLKSLHKPNQSNAWQINKPVTTIILLACFFYALSTLWSQIDFASAWLAWSRYARLITIPLMFYLIKNHAQGLLVLRAFTGTQVFVGLSSWLLILGIHPPWISAIAPDETFASFGTYLEESVAQAAMVGILWFKRDTIFGPKGKPFAVLAIIGSLSLVLFYLNGRTGHIAMLGIVALACLHALPARIRPLALLTPFLAVGLLWFSSPHFQQRSLTTYQELVNFRNNNNIVTSIGTRLHFWTISLQGMAAHPITGVGAGSWKVEYQRQTESSGDATSSSIQGADDPHQLFLLWGVEGGLMGLGLLIATLTLIWRQSRHLESSDAWALRAVVLALLLASMFNSILHGIGMGDFFCVGIGIILSLALGKTSKTKASQVD
jgi:hypothetical protein